MEIREFLDGKGRSPFRSWFERLDRIAAAKVYTVLTRLALGNVSNVKSVGGGVYESRVAFGRAIAFISAMTVRRS